MDATFYELDKSMSTLRKASLDLAAPVEQLDSTIHALVDKIALLRKDCLGLDRRLDKLEKPS